jgi:hypothetical protein
MQYLRGAWAGVRADMLDGKNGQRVARAAAAPDAPAPAAADDDDGDGDGDAPATVFDSTKLEAHGTKDQQEDTSKFVTWSSVVVNLIEASLQHDDWDAYVSRARAVPFTLMHGDFHPANMMLSCATDSTAARASASASDASASDASASASDANTDSLPLQIYLLDFEMMGVGMGATDLGQYMVSHLHPMLRKKHEATFIKTYYTHLSAIIGTTASSTYSHEECFRDYVRGGVEKWMFLLVVMARFSPPMLQVSSTSL